MRTLSYIVGVMSIMMLSGCSGSPESNAGPQSTNGDRRASAASPVEVLPVEITGVWGTPDAEFRGGMVVHGGALYLGTDGFAALVGAPPPIGMAGPAAYSSETRTLTLDLDTGDEPERLQVSFIHDPKSRQLKTVPTPDILAGTYTRHMDKIPESVLEEFR